MKKLFLIVILSLFLLVGCGREEVIYFEDQDIFDSVYEVEFNDFEMYYKIERPLVGHTQEKYIYDQGPITIDRAEEIFINYLDGLGWVAKEKDDESKMFHQTTFENSDYENNLIMYSEARGMEEVRIFLEFPNN